MFCIYSWPRAIAHVDADAFFVACEGAINPHLNGKCVAVGKERGIITALSYSAKAKGVKRGMRLYEAKKICKDLIIIESDYETYSLFSERMFNIIKRFSPQVEEYSIDEAFVDLTGLRRLFHGSYEDIAHKIQQTIKKELSISVSVGVSISKVLAKIASKKNKPYGVVAIDGKSIENYIRDVQIEEVWGIGPNTASLLKKFGILTALDFAQRKESFIEKYLSKPYYEIWQELRGILVFEVSSTPKKTYKSISKAKSFLPSTVEAVIFSELIKNLEDACAKARRFNLFAKKIIVCLKNNDFKNSCIKLKLDTATVYPSLITHLVRQAFSKLYCKNTLYRQSAIVLSDLTEQKEYDLFNTLKLEKTEKLYSSIDTINAKFGRNTLHLAPSIKAHKSVKKTKGLSLLGMKIEI